MQHSLAYEKKHVFKYILKNIPKYTPISIKMFSETIMSFQEIIEAISKYIFKQNKSAIQFSFNTTFPSSFGVLLSTKFNDAELLSKTYFSIEYFFKLLSDLNSDTTLLESLKNQEKYPKLLQKIKKYYEVQSSYLNDVEIVWGDVFGRDMIVHVEKDRMLYISSILEKYDEIPDETIEIEGLLKGISLLKLKIEILDSSGECITIFGDENTIIDSKKYFNEFIIATTIRHHKMNENTDEVIDIYSLVSISTKSNDINII